MQHLPTMVYIAQFQRQTSAHESSVSIRVHWQLGYIMWPIRHAADVRALPRASPACAF